MSIDSPQRHWPWTVQDWLELNARSAGPRYELLNGGLLVTPPPAWAHQWAGDELRAVLRTALPVDLRVATAVGVVLRPGESALIPDLVIARRVRQYRAGRGQRCSPTWPITRSANACSPGLRSPLSQHPV